MIKPFPKQALVFKCLSYKYNTVGKRKIARTKQFLLFPTVFSTRLENVLLSISKLPSANSYSLKESKICHLGKGQSMTKMPGL